MLMHVCVCIYQMSAYNRKEVGATAIFMTDEVEVWNEGKMFAWGAVRLAWVGWTKEKNCWGNDAGCDRLFVSSTLR